MAKHTGEELTLRQRPKGKATQQNSIRVTRVILIFACSVRVQIIVINFLKFIYTASTKPTIRGIQFLYMALCESGKLGSLIITCATFDQSSLLTRRKAIPKPKESELCSLSHEESQVVVSVLSSIGVLSAISVRTSRE